MNLIFGPFQALSDPKIAKENFSQKKSFKSFLTIYATLTSGKRSEQLLVNF